MSFGFSVGDIITVGNLIADIINSLREAGGSKSEYQEVIRELETLDGVLKHIDQLKPSRSPSGSLDSIKYAALSCRQPLEQFLGKIRKYENGLGVWEKRRGLGLAKDKLQWALGHKKEIGKLQSYLYIHIGTINMLLAEHGLERMDIISENIEADSLHVRERLDGTRSIMQYIKDSVTAQAAVIRTTHVMLAKMFQMVSGELTTSLATLGDTVAKMCVTTQQIHGVVLDIRDSLGAVDTRWTFFQAPLAIEDALGFKFPFLSEYDYGYLEVILKHRFLEGPGSLAVKDGNYEVFATRNSAQIISEDVRLRPGTALTMAILVAGPIFDEECPMPHCHSSRTSLIPDGGRICGDCDVRFERSEKKRKTVDAPMEIIEPGHSSNLLRTLILIELPQGKDNEYAFKNVRYSTTRWEEYWNLESSHLSGRRGIDMMSNGKTNAGNFDAWLHESRVPIPQLALRYLCKCAGGHERVHSQHSKLR